MGVSSSQPIPSSQDHPPSLHPAKPPTTPSVAKSAPRYTPTMDDEAASQQLMSEARADPHSADYRGPAIPLKLDGASRRTISRNPTLGKKNKSKKLGKMQVASSQNGKRDAESPSPLPVYSLKDLQAFVGTSPSKSRKPASTVPSTQIEVPDSQTETQTNGASEPAPLTASQTTQPDASRNRPKRNKKNVQTENGLNNGNTIPATPYEEVAGGAMPSSAEAIESKSSQKRRKNNKSRTSLNGANLDTAEVEVAKSPAATQEATLETAPGGSEEQNGGLDTKEQPLTPRALLGELNADRLQKSQSAGNATSPANTPDDAPDHTPIGSQLLDAAAAADTTGTPEATQSAKKRKRSKRGKQIAESAALEGDALVESLDNTSAQPSASGDSPGGDVNSKPKREKKSARHSVGGVVSRTPKRSRADPNKNYERAHDDDDRTAADKALETTHELGHPPDKRRSGDFTADERELIRRAIRDYQERNGLDTADLVDIIQWSYNNKSEMGGNSTDQVQEQFKKDCNAFWEEIENIGLLRKLRETRKHIRVTYHTCQRGRWSQDEDEQLEELTNLHPGQWKLIATQLNRRELDAYNRWKDYVRHGENRLTKRWTDDEEESLVRVLSLVCQRVEDLRAELGQPPLDDYQPIINWHEVCREMGDTRSRLQCQSKWKIMRARVPPAALNIEIKPRKDPPPQEAAAEVPQKSRRRSKVEKNRQSTVPGPDDMLWGDKFDLVDELIQQATADENVSDEQIGWQDIVEKMNQRWSVRTLRTAYKQLCELVLDPETDDNLTARLFSIYAFIKDSHFNEVEDRYQPAQEDKASDKDGSQKDTSKKRKRQKATDSGKASTKKRNKTTADSANVIKSKEIITDSDDAENEPEL
ncbi:hypothetical protein C7974DRAFT_1991 [Boeremia exigua]|uniref:uncharacterized protein n=1 Tax=Boeremia exigua TaxID=749465 RepID=UPI001E8D760D|nr:uncharacterized protein C7974DRAFT_1991 [Boeremia exigua]KAH6643642.1 hypothetical protein C7974DRAFT_1991 [Boeremia exigua]